MDDKLDNLDARSEYVFEEPHEALILEGDASHDPSRGTVEPWEEPPNTQGFQHGSWDYNEGRRDAGQREQADAGGTDAGADGGAGDNDEGR